MQNLDNVKVLINQKTEEIWFVAKDILQILLDNPNPNVSDSTKDLESNELAYFKTIPTNSKDTRLKDMLIVSESGLYSLIMRSRKPIAKPFQRLVTQKILPAIRKNGYYISQEITDSQVDDLFDEIQSIYKGCFKLL